MNHKAMNLAESHQVDIRVPIEGAMADTVTMHNWCVMQFENSRHSYDSVLTRLTKGLWLEKRQIDYWKTSDRLFLLFSEAWVASGLEMDIVGARKCIRMGLKNYAKIRNGSASCGVEKIQADGLSDVAKQYFSARAYLDAELIDPGSVSSKDFQLLPDVSAMRYMNQCFALGLPVKIFESYAAADEYTLDHPPVTTHWCFQRNTLAGVLGSVSDLTDVITGLWKVFLPECLSKIDAKTLVGDRAEQLRCMLVLAVTWFQDPAIVLPFHKKFPQVIDISEYSQSDKYTAMLALMDDQGEVIDPLVSAALSSFANSSNPVERLMNCFMAVKRDDAALERIRVAAEHSDEDLDLSPTIIKFVEHLLHTALLLSPDSKWHQLAERLNARSDLMTVVQLMYWLWKSVGIISVRNLTLSDSKKRSLSSFNDHCKGWETELENSEGKAALLALNNAVLDLKQAIKAGMAVNPSATQERVIDLLTERDPIVPMNKIFQAAADQVEHLPSVKDLKGAHDKAFEAGDLETMTKVGEQMKSLMLAGQSFSSNIAGAISPSAEFLADIESFKGFVKELEESVKAPQEPVEAGDDDVTNELLEECASLETTVSELMAKSEAQEHTIRSLQHKLENAAGHTAVEQSESALVETLMKAVLSEESMTNASVLDIAQKLEPGLLTVLPSAIETAKAAAFAYPKRVLGQVLKIAEYAKALNAGEPDATARNILGGSYAAGESDTTLSNDRLRKMREFDVNGEAVLFAQHCTIGYQRDARECIQIHFKIIDGKAVIGRVGDHLTTGCKKA